MKQFFNIVLPMAGKGSRFSKLGYKDPKPLIEVSGKPMVVQSAKSLPNSKDYIFVTLKEHLEKYTKSEENLLVVFGSPEKGVHEIIGGRMNKVQNSKSFKGDIELLKARVYNNLSGFYMREQIFDKAEEAQTKDRTVKDLLEQLAQLEIDIKAADGDRKAQKQAEFAALKETIDELQSQKVKSDET